MARPNKFSGKNSLCWECKNTACRWIREGKPVKGWTAEKTNIHNVEKDVPSYNVKKCPEFLGAVDYEDVRCPECRKLLFRREKRKGTGIISVKCRRCGKINLIYPEK